MMLLCLSKIHVIGSCMTPKHILLRARLNIAIEAEDDVGNEHGVAVATSQGQPIKEHVW